MSRWINGLRAIAIQAKIFALAAGVSAGALAETAPTGTGYVVKLASPAQALAFCQGQSRPIGISYYKGRAGEAQFGKKCAQGVPTHMVRDAVMVDNKQVFDCALSPARQAVALCKNGGIEDGDVAYIAGPAATVISGPASGCAVSQTTLEVSKAICKY